MTSTFSEGAASDGQVPDGPASDGMSPDSTAPAAASAAMGEHIRDAWSDETLLLPLRDTGRARRLPGQPKHSRLAGLGGPARVELLGTGETFAAWHLRAANGTELLVRVPWHEPAHPLADELAALTQIPPGLGPEPLALHESAETSPLGTPYLVTTPVPGRILAPSRWTRHHLLAHAERLAHLHRTSTPGRGPVSLGEDPWERMETGRLSLLELFEADTETVDDQVLEAIGGPTVLRAAARRLRETDAAFADLEGFVLSHGDLCATNIVWEDGAGAEAPRPLPRFIDFEWAMGDDPARDLAIIGGAVHGGPWYLPLDDDAIDALVSTYITTRQRLAREGSDEPRFEGQVPAGAGSDAGTNSDAGASSDMGPGSDLDPSALRARRDAWEIFEKTAMLLHVAGRAADRGAAAKGTAAPVTASSTTATGTATQDHYSTVLPTLRDTLRAHLGAD